MHGTTCGGSVSAGTVGSRPVFIHNVRSQRKNDRERGSVEREEFGWSTPCGNLIVVAPLFVLFFIAAFRQKQPAVSSTATKTMEQYSYRSAVSRRLVLFVCYFLSYVPQ